MLILWAQQQLRQEHSSVDDVEALLIAKLYSVAARRQHISTTLFLY